MPTPDTEGKKGMLKTKQQRRKCNFLDHKSKPLCLNWAMVGLEMSENISFASNIYGVNNLSSFDMLLIALSFADDIWPIPGELELLRKVFE